MDINYQNNDTSILDVIFPLEREVTPDDVSNWNPDSSSDVVPVISRTSSVDEDMVLQREYIAIESDED